MKKMIFLVSIMLTTAVLSAQSVWYFGNHGGLVFPGGGNLLPPSPFAGSNMKAAEGCTVVCDNNGNVVFYTDGKHLFDGSNVEITDQFDPARQLLGGPSSTQAALALPIPGSDCKRFLVFTTVGIEDHVNNNALGVCLITVSGSPPYTVVADFPALPVTASNIQFSEKLAATGDETNGFWLLAHDWSGTTDARTFYKYHITETAFLNVFTTADAVKALPGVQYIQVSALWQSQGGSGDNGEYNAQGQMKFDKAGSQLGLVIAGDDVVEIYNFSKASGLLDRTFSFDVPSAGNLYGFEFSPDGTMFYTAEDYTNQVNCNTDPQTYLAQTRDLKQWSPPNTIPYIVATVTTCNPYEFNQLQLGPDNKIYCAGPQSSTTSLSVIDFPDIPGTDCDWHENTIPVANNRMSGLPIVVENSVCNTSIISGYKFNDLNGDGIWLAEPGLAGWVIDLIPVGAPKQSCTTNSNGYYEFADLPAGTYTVTENHQVGWTQTYPYPTKYYQFYLPVNTSTLPINFGNCLGIDPPAGMVAWWPLDELAGPIANDLMGTNNFGTYAGNPAPTNFTGKVAGSLWFNRPVDWPVPDYVEVQDHDDLDFGEGDFSIDAWISPADYPIEFDPDYETIVDKSIDINGKHLGYTLSMYGLNYLALELGDGNNSQTYFSNPFQFLIDGNHWHHVTITVDKTVSHEIKFYIDGVLQGTTPTASGNLDNTNMLRIACASDQVANLFYGRIDEVEMFNRKLEVSEILNISNSGACGKHKPQGKICGFKFNDINGNGIYDSGTEPKVPGWTIQLSGDRGTTTAVTDSYGNYCFEQLWPGAYTVSEVQQTIWTQTCPPITGNYHFFLPADQSVSDIYFGNRQCVDPPGGMKAWWPLDEITGSTAKDLMGVDNTGTYVGNPPPTFSSGKVAGSLWFNRPVDWPVPDYIEVQDHDELDFGEGDFSIDAWISPADYPVEFGLDYETIVDKSIDINGKHLGYTLSMYGLNNLVLELGDGTVSQTYFSNPFQFLIDGNHWYHVTVTVDKTVSHEIKFYIDGILKGTSPTSPGSLDNTNVLRIACASDQIANLFYGRLDEIEIFNRILEPDEISDLYNSGIQGKCKDPLYIAANISPIHCNGSTIGTVDIVVTGGLPPYYYEWSNGGSGELIVGLGAGFYTVTVTDNGGKGVSASFEVTEPPALATSGSVGMTSCVGVADGSINLFVTGGVAPYSFIWSNGAVSRNISGLVAGTYTISVSDANGCTTANNFLVGEKPLNPVGVSIVASVNPVCAGNFVTFTATPSNGGNLPSYQWVVNGTNVGTNNATYTYVPADNDEVKCRLVSNATCVSGNPATSNTITMIVNSPTATGSICGFKYSDLNGNGVFDGSDERLAYWTIQLSGDANATAVTDVNGEYCFEHLFMGHYQVSEVSQIRWTQTYPSPRTHDILLSCGQSISNINFGNRPCVKPPDGMTNWWPLDETMGTIAVDKKGFNNVGDYASSPNQPVQIPGMVQGSLKFVNTNQLVEVPDNSEINFGTGDFSIDAWISFSSTSGNVNILDKAQGTRGYSLSIINGVLALTLGDANGFYTYLSTASIPAGPWVHVAVTVDRSATHLVTFYCNGVASNGINLQTNLGSLTNTATLKIGGTTFTSNGAQLDEIETFSRVLSQQEVFDIYNSDSNGKCKTLGNICGFKFEDLDGDGVFDTGEPKLEGWDIHLSGPGIVDIETTTGANGYYCFDQLVSGDYTISEELKGLWVQTYPPPSPDPQNGKHSFNLSEGEGLTNINFGNKRLLPNPYPLPDISNVTCYSGADGTISLTITGGTLPYIYLWNNFQTTSSIHSLSSGTYTVTVTDAGSLTYIGSWTVTEPAAVAVTNVVTNVTCAQASTGMIDISVTGGTPPYFYVWSNGAATQNISGLIAGNYTVTVTDANGCVETTSQAVVVDPLQPVVAPILENFEATSFPPVCWTNTIVSAFYAWARSDTASGNGVGAASAFANFFDQETGAYELKTFPFDISGLASPVLQFNYAYATYVSEIDEMIVYYSPDAGATWHTLLAMPGGISGILNTGGATEESFVPAASQWGTQTLPLPAGTNMLKFKAISSYGNNLYLDNINIMEEPVIPVNNTVQNAVVSGNACYNATNVISVAGGGTVFTVSAGGEAIFIAGQKISFLSGTNVQPEGYLHGFIRPAGPYCGAKAASFTAVPAGEPEIYSVAEKSFFKVYPNPTTGSFSLELTSIEQSAELRVEIYGMHGERVLSAELRGQRKYELSLAGKPVGVYFIRVVIGKFTGTLKIVKH